MRLIDADALESKVLKWMPTDPCGREEKEYPFETDIVVSLMMEIREAPTIEPKKGEWIGEGDGYADGGIVYDTWYCSNCDHCEEGEELALPNFCPNCGAKMKGTDDED